MLSTKFATAAGDVRDAQAAAIEGRGGLDVRAALAHAARTDHGPQSQGGGGARTPRARTRHGRAHGAPVGDRRPRDDDRPTAHGRARFGRARRERSVRWTRAGGPPAPAPGGAEQARRTRPSGLPPRSTKTDRPTSSEARPSAAERQRIKRDRDRAEQARKAAARELAGADAELEKATVAVANAREKLADAERRHADATQRRLAAADSLDQTDKALAALEA